ncbi:MAG: cell envelope integrity protein TolA [Alphaproteobacteria bacterium]|nr:cell envelope integrity protein TolA [Alphaproteobacteria bacterium]
MRGPLVVSVLFHALILLMTAVGLPYLVKEPVIVNPVSVELVTIDELTQTNKRAPPVKEEKPKEIEAPKPPEAPPSPPKNTAEAPPDLTTPKPPEPVKEKPKEEPEPVPPPKPVQKAVSKPKPKPPAPVKPKEEPKKDFQSLLKNLTPDAAETSEKTEEQPLEEPTTTGQIANLADKLTISELDAFKHQIEPCWIVPSGAKYAENLAVEVRVIMNRDASVKSANVLDQGRYGRDPSFRAAADSALRALRNQRCQPLKLPLEKYDQWKTIVINFDPSDMLR